MNKITVFDAEPLSSMERSFLNLPDTNSFQSLTFKKVIGKFHCQNIQRNTLLLGLFQFTVLPFGLVTAQASCSRLMRKLLQSLQNVDNFVDDIIIFHSNLFGIFSNYCTCRTCSDSTHFCFWFWSTRMA